MRAQTALLLATAGLALAGGGFILGLGLDPVLDNPTGVVSTSVAPPPDAPSPAASATRSAPRRTAAPADPEPTATRERTTQAPRRTSPPPVRQTDPDVVPSYRNCDDLRLDHPAGVETGHPAYRKALDRDNDGWACDPE